MYFLAKFLALPWVRNWLIKRAQRSPYYDIPGYMNRWWLFNGDKEDGTPKYPWLWRLRVHHILRADDDRHKHDHPSDFRTFILAGWYIEDREDGKWYVRVAGDTATLNFGEYHSIREVPLGGVWTLFVLGPSKGMWGFLVNGEKMPWRDYMAQKHRIDYADHE
jgi:hypothetical protein